jgi:subtilase family serine protease
VIAGGGAGYLTVDGRSLTGVAGGTVLATPGWATARSRFDIDATAGVSRLTVIRW